MYFVLTITQSLAFLFEIAHKGANCTDDFC